MYTPPDPWTEYDRAAAWFAEYAHQEGTRSLDVSDQCAALVQADPAAFRRRIQAHARRFARDGTDLARPGWWRAA